MLEDTSGETLAIEMVKSLTNGMANGGVVIGVASQGAGLRLIANEADIIENPCQFSHKPSQAALKARGQPRRTLSMQIALLDKETEDSHVISWPSEGCDAWSGRWLERDVTKQACGHLIHGMASGVWY